MFGTRLSTLHLFINFPLLFLPFHLSFPSPILLTPRNNLRYHNRTNNKLRTSVNSSLTVLRVHDGSHAEFYVTAVVGIVYEVGHVDEGVRSREGELADLVGGS